MLAFRAIQGAGWLLVSRFAGKIVDFFTLLFLARVLAPSDFGLASLAISLVAVVDTVLEIPVTQALVRLPAIDKSHLDTSFTLSILRSILIAVIILGVAWPFSAFNHNSALFPLVTVLAIGPIVKGVTSPAMVHYARNLGFRQTFLMEFTGKFTAFFVTMALLWMGAGYWAIAANFVANIVIAVTASYILAPYWPKLTLSRFSDFSNFIGWFSLSQIIAALNWQFDRMVVGAATDNTTLGRYAVASDIANIPSQAVIGPAMQPVLSAFSRISGDVDRLRSAFMKAARFSMLISAPTCVGIALTSDLLTDLLLGPKWSAAAAPLSLLALSAVAMPYFQTLYTASLALNQANVPFKINAIDFAFRVALISCGVYFYSAMGASVAKVALCVVMFSVYLREARLLLQLSIATQLRNIWKVVTSTLIMAIIVFALRERLEFSTWNHVVELAVLGSVGALTYGLALLGLGVRLHIGGGRFEIFDRP